MSRHVKPRPNQKRCKSAAVGWFDQCLGANRYEPACEERAERRCVAGRHLGPDEVIFGNQGKARHDQLAAGTATRCRRCQLDRDLQTPDQPMSECHQPALIGEDAQVGSVVPRPFDAWMILEVGTLRQ